MGTFEKQCECLEKLWVRNCAMIHQYFIVGSSDGTTGWALAQTNILLLTLKIDENSCIISTLTLHNSILM